MHKQNTTCLCCWALRSLCFCLNMSFKSSFLLTNGIGFRFFDRRTSGRKYAKQLFYRHVWYRHRQRHVYQRSTKPIRTKSWSADARLSIRLIVALVSYWVLFKAPIRFQSYLKEFLQNWASSSSLWCLSSERIWQSAKHTARFFVTITNSNSISIPTFHWPLWENSLMPNSNPNRRLKPSPKMPKERGRRQEKLVVFVAETRARPILHWRLWSTHNAVTLQTKRYRLLLQFLFVRNGHAILVPCMFSKFGHDDLGQR